jgi:hypothetical protein
MARYKHPRAIGVDDPAEFAVDVGGEHVPVDSDGCFETDDETAVRAIAQANGLSVDDLRVDGDNGDGCPYCDDYDGEHVAQHIAQAHPDVED